MRVSFEIEESGSEGKSKTIIKYKVGSEEITSEHPTGASDIHYFANILYSAQKAMYGDKDRRIQRLARDLADATGVSNKSYEDLP